VRFNPSLPEKAIKKEGVRMATKMLEVQAEKEYQENLRKEKEAQEQQIVSLITLRHTIVRYLQ